MSFKFFNMHRLYLKNDKKKKKKRTERESIEKDIKVDGLIS